MTTDEDGPPEGGGAMKRRLLARAAVLICLPLYLAFIAVSFSAPWVTPAAGRSSAAPPLARPVSVAGLPLTVGSAAGPALQALYVANWRVIAVDSVARQDLQFVLHHPRWPAGRDTVPARLQLHSRHGLVMAWAFVVAPASADAAARILGAWLAGGGRDWGRARVARDARAEEARKRWFTPDSLVAIRRRVFWGRPPLTRVPSVARYWDWWGPCGVLEIGADDPALLEMRSEMPAELSGCQWRAARPAPLDPRTVFAPIPWTQWVGRLDPTGAPTVQVTPDWWSLLPADSLPP